MIGCDRERELPSQTTFCFFDRVFRPPFIVGSENAPLATPASEIPQPVFHPHRGSKDGQSDDPVVGGEEKEIDYGSE